VLPPRTLAFTITPLSPVKQTLMWTWLEVFGTALKIG
jgi:hypothetical protein